MPAIVHDLWNKELFGSDVYHLIAAFIIYSVMGWVVESIYMSFCNHKLTNRGFAKGPFCPIYGFGGVVGYLILSPLRGRFVPLYFLGAFTATTFEYLVGIGMQRLFGEIWWDYHEKPFNYKGIICLESTVAWGFYAIFIIQVLNDKIYTFIDRYDQNIGIFCCCLVMAAVIFDYVIQLRSIARQNDFSLPDFMRENRQALSLYARNRRTSIARIAHRGQESLSRGRARIIRQRDRIMDYYHSRRR